MRGLVVALVVVSAWGSAHAGPEEVVVARVNAARKLAGLAAVSLDSTLTKGCMEHTEYLRLNHGTAAVAGLEAHKQQPDLPGATKAGAACGKDADLYPGVSDVGTAVDGWMAGIYHRRPILDPKLQKIGLGYATLADGTYIVALQFVSAQKAKGAWPVLYPADKQTDVPMEYGAEIPNPIPKNGTGGYPITLQFPAFDKVTGVSASLAAGKKSIPIHLSSPEKPATSFSQGGMISVIAKQPLAPSTTYTVKIEATWQGKAQTWTWSFTTVALAEVDASNETAITNAIGVPSLVRGTVSHAGMIDAATVFLAIAGGDKRKLVSVVIPLPIWKQIARMAKPATYKGRKLEVQATPRLVKNQYINLPISGAAQLTFKRK